MLFRSYFADNGQKQRTKMSRRFASKSARHSGDEKDAAGRGRTNGPLATTPAYPAKPMVTAYVPQLSPRASNGARGSRNFKSPRKERTEGHGGGSCFSSSWSGVFLEGHRGFSPLDTVTPPSSWVQQPSKTHAFPLTISQVAPVAKNPPAHAGDRRQGFDPWAQKSPWRGARPPTPVSVPGEACGQEGLAGCGPWGSKSWARPALTFPFQF